MPEEESVRCRRLTIYLPPRTRERQLRSLHPEHGLGIRSLVVIVDEGLNITALGCSCLLGGDPSVIGHRPDQVIPCRLPRRGLTESLHFALPGLEGNRRLCEERRDERKLRRIGIGRIEVGVGKLPLSLLLGECGVADGDGLARKRCSDSRLGVIGLRVRRRIAAACRRGPQIEAVRFQRRPTDPPLSAKSIRVPLAEILQIVLTEAVMEVTELSPGHYKIAPLRGDERSAQVRKATVVHTRRQPTGARRLYTDAEARKALTLYRQAKRNEQKDPFRWVGEQLSRSRSNAYTMVKDAERQEEERRGRSRRKAK